jgi:hypothetical protein
MADPATMRAVLYYGPGDLRLIQAPARAPREGEIVVRINTALTCGTVSKAIARAIGILARTPSPFDMRWRARLVGWRGSRRLREGERVVVLTRPRAIAVISVSKARRNSAIISNCLMAPMLITFASPLTSRGIMCFRFRKISALPKQP